MAQTLSCLVDDKRKNYLVVHSNLFGHGVYEVLFGKWFSIPD
jgi:hypothetical protein